MLRIGLVAFAVIVAYSQPSLAQDWQPDHPIRLVAGFSPASTVDLMARALAASLGKQLGQAVIVENRSGAAGRAALEYNAKADPDGYTIQLSGTGPLAIDPALQHFRLPALQPISQVASGPMAIVVLATAPEKTVADLIAQAKARPGSLNFGSAGVGSTPHLAGALFALTAGVQIVHVPYRGNADALTDLLAGRIQILFTGLPPVVPLIKAGQLRALAIMANTRSPSVPDVPTTAEAGLPGAGASSIYGVVGPPNMDKAALKRLNSEIRKALASPELRETFASLGSNTVSTTPEEYGQLLRDDAAKWTDVIAKAHITIN